LETDFAIVIGPGCAMPIKPSGAAFSQRIGAEYAAHTRTVFASTGRPKLSVSFWLMSRAAVWSRRPSRGRDKPDQLDGIILRKRRSSHLIASIAMSAFHSISIRSAAANRNFKRRLVH
jgi:hypothetical protein